MKTKHTTNSIIKHIKMDREIFQSFPVKISLVKKSKATRAPVKILIKNQNFMEETLDKHFMCFWSNPFVVFVYL
jgi:hypothetical protein